MKTHTSLPSLASLILLTLLPGSLQAQAEPKDPYQPSIPSALVKKVDAAKELQVSQNLPTKATNLLKEVIAAEPDYYRAWHNLGLIYQNQGQTEEALQALNQARKIRNEKQIPDYSILNSTGWALLNTGKLDDAENLFKEVLENEAKNSLITNQRTLNNLGYLYLQKGETDRAAFYLTRSKTEFKSPGADKLLALVKDYENRKRPEHQQQTAPRPSRGFAFYGFKKNEGEWTDMNFNKLTGSSPTDVPKAGDKLQTNTEVNIRENVVQTVDGQTVWPAITGVLDQKERISAGGILAFKNAYGTYFWVELK